MLNYQFSKTARVVCAIAAACALPTMARAETLIGVTVYRELITFDSATPGEILTSTEITGLTYQNNFESVRSIDVRPATNELYGVGNAPGGIYTLYKIEAAGGEATQVGTLQPVPGSLAFNFEPTSDRVRIVADNEQNFRYNPANAALIANDGNLAYASGDPGFGTNPNVVTVSYTNSAQGASSTTLYVIDTARDVLAIQEPNTGVLTTVGPLGIDVPSFVDPASLEISAATGTAYMTLINPGAQTSHLYTLNLGTGAATLVGEIGTNRLVRSITTVPPPAPPEVLKLWAAGRDLIKNEEPDSAKEAAANNPTVPEWTYGYRAAAVANDLTLFTADQHTNNHFNNPKLQGWSVNAPAHVFVNTGSGAIEIPSTAGPLKPIFPGIMAFKPSTGAACVVRWIAPESGRYNIGAQWLDLDRHGGNGVSCHLIVKGEERFRHELANDGSIDMPLKVIDLNQGDVIDFVTAANGNADFDTTGFNAAIRRAPQVVITSPTAGQSFTAGDDIVVTAAVEGGHPAASVSLRRLTGETLGTDTSAPYEFSLPDVDAGIDYIQAVAVDEDGVEGASQVVELTVKKRAPANGRAKALARPSSSAPAANAAEPCENLGCVFEALFGAVDYVFLPESGDWYDPNNWASLYHPEGTIPDERHSVLIGQSTVTLSEVVIVGSVYLREGGRIIGPPELAIEVREELSMAGEISDIALRLPPGARFTSVLATATFNNVLIINDGDVIISGDGSIKGTGSKVINGGVVYLINPPASPRQVEVAFAAMENKGSLVMAPNTRATIADFLGNGHVRLITDNGAGLIGGDVASAISENGAGLISDKGVGLVGPDGASLVGPDGASLIGADAATLIGADAATAKGHSVQAASASKSLVEGGTPETNAAEGTPGLVFAGGTVTGTGNIVGAVTNSGAFFAPGNSGGVIRVLGNYTQEQNGTLLIEVGGTEANPPQFDQLQIRGAANLGGNLIVKTINGFTPQSGDTFSPLTYNSVSGSFAKVTSNAQVNFGPDGMTMQVAGPNPPAPKALNIATRMRVETGDNVLIAGFIVTGSQPKKVLIRGLGPSLPVGDALADPTLDLDGGAVFNDDWRASQEGEINETTIAPSSDLESAIVAVLEPGLHTAVLRGKNDGTGVGLVEVYDLESGTPAQLANISTRGQVQTGDNVMIGGFIIGGDYPAKVLIRAIGPSLPVDGALQNPTLELVDSQGNTISNDNWRATQEAEIIATTVPPTNDREAAIVATLVPGNYTAVVRGKDDTIGVALVEGYNLE